MAEVIGTVASVVTLAALFKSCIDAFEIIRTAHNQEFDLRKLVLKLNLEKCRLYTWGEAMGLTAANAEQPVTATCPFHNVMTETLQMLLRLFEDSERLQNIYGCKQFLDASYSEKESTGEVKHLALSFKNLQLKGTRRSKKSKFLNQARWAIHDRKKFANFVSDVKDYVDGLQNITKTVAPPSVQDKTVNKRIETIDDVETLDMLSEACQEDHPDIARVASNRAETISMASTDRWKIEHWDCVDGLPETDEVDLEALSITELRHHVYRMAKERQELEIRLQWFQNVLMDPHLILSRSADAFLTNRRRLRTTVFELKQQPASDFQAEWTKQNVKNLLLERYDSTPIVSGLIPSAAATQMVPVVASAKPPSAVGQSDAKASNVSLIGELINGDHFADLAPVQRTGYIVNESEDEEPSDPVAETFDESTDAFENIPAKKAPSSHHFGEEAVQEESYNTRTHDSESSGRTLMNGFLQFDFLTEGIATAAQRDDYFVLSFNAPRSVSDAFQGHSHYVEAQYIAKIAHTKNYIPFDIKSWPRDLQISGIVDGASIDKGWVQAMKEFDFQVNIFAIPVQPLMVCSAPNGGCLRAFFDVLAENELCAICFPAIVASHSLTPKVCILPLGKHTLIPSFITLTRPDFTPTSDVLLVVMAFVGVNWQTPEHLTCFPI